MLRTLAPRTTIRVWARVSTLVLAARFVLPFGSCCELLDHDASAAATYSTAAMEHGCCNAHHEHADSKDPRNPCQGSDDTCWCSIRSAAETRGETSTWSGTTVPSPDTAVDVPEPLVTVSSAVRFGRVADRWHPPRSAPLSAADSPRA